MIEKVIKVINSCTNNKHIESCRKMIENHEDKLLYREIIDKREYVLREYKGLVEGDKVIVIGNENNPAWSGEIVSYFDNNGKWTNQLPIVKKTSNNKEYLCMGIVLPYSNIKLNKLNALDYKERWNSVCREHCKL